MDGARRDIKGEILTFVKSYWEQNGYPPTYQEICDTIGLSSRSHADYYLDALEDAGLIERLPRRPRGLRIVGWTPNAFEVQVEGLIAAGRPIELAQRLDQSIELTADIADPRRELFALRVEGDSMTGDLVGDGDLLIAERAVEVRTGQMAVVHLRDRNAATLKHVYQLGPRVRLKSSNPAVEPFDVDARDVEIQGRVAAIIRRP